MPGGVAVHLESRHHQLAVRAVLHVGSHREPLASAGWRTRPSSGARRRGQGRGGGRWTSPLSRSCVMASCGCPHDDMHSPAGRGAGLMRIRRSKNRCLGEEAMQALGAIRPESAAPDVPVFGLQPAAIAARIRAADGSRPRWWAGTPRGQRRGGGPLSH